MFELEGQAKEEHRDVRYGGKLRLEASIIWVSRNRKTYFALHSLETSKKVFPNSIKTAKLSVLFGFRDLYLTVDISCTTSIFYNSDRTV